MKFPICVVNTKHTSSFGIVSLLLAIAPLWLMLTAINTSAHAQTSPADWIEFHRDNMQRWNPYETVLGVGNVGQLGLKWSYATGGNVLSSPAVVNGVIYFGSEDGNVYALNASTGAKLWSYATGYEVLSSPAVVNGVVYFGSEVYGKMYALNASTGALLWSYTPSAAYGSDVRSSPTVVNGVVYFGSNDGSVYALNASTGAKLWSYATGAPIWSSPAVANGVVYVGSEDSYLYALNASTGALLWTYYVGYATPIDNSPAVANGVVYFSDDFGSNYALNASTGAQLWHFYVPEGGNVISSPAVASGVVYFGFSTTGSPPGNGVFALNASTGAQLWSYNPTGTGVNSSPAVANGVVYYLDENGYVHALNASTGANLWSYSTGAGASGFNDSSPAVVNGTLYVGSGTQMYAFGLGASSADLFLRIIPTPTTVHQGDLITYAFPVWNLGPNNAVHEVLNTQVPPGTTLDYIRISGTPGLGTCTSPPYQGTGPIVCHENSAMAPNTTWTVRVVVKVTAPPGTVITENAATLADTPDPNMANNMATVSLTVQ